MENAVRMARMMVSQPMAGKSEEQIEQERNDAIRFAQENGYEFVNTLFTDDWYKPEAMADRGVVNIPLCFLARSLENMATCEIAYFANGWENARGCRIEHDAAKAYGMQIIYAEEK